jgi:hypothetical protein
MQLDRTAEVAFGKAEFASVEVILAEADVIGFLAGRALRAGVTHAGLYATGRAWILSRWRAWSGSIRGGRQALGRIGLRLQRIAQPG